MSAAHGKFDMVEPNSSSHSPSIVLQTSVALHGTMISCTPDTGHASGSAHTSAVGDGVGALVGDSEGAGVGLSDG